jgi:Large-conductance mechanosensitive channel, MscL
MLEDFRAFILRGTLVDLAVAVVIGAAFGAVVASLVENLITPLTAAVGGRPDFGGLAFTINGSTFGYGAFLNALITFLIIAPGPDARALGPDRDPRPAQGRERPDSMSRRSRRAAASGQGANSTA